jgi:hypothetical protein
MPMHRLIALFVLTLAAFTAHAIYPDPWADWRTADTAHFRIHYHAESRAQAERVGAIAERVYQRIAQQLQWQARGRTEVVLFSEFDVANGYATPLPFNLLGIYLAVPDEGELLDNSEWLELVITHELTHTVQLDKVRGVPQVLQWIFGRSPLFFPNAWQPVWALEGIAVRNEGDAAAGRGRLYSPIFEALLRVERAQGFKSLAQLNSHGRALPLSKDYLYGAYFMDFVARKYGRDAVVKYVHYYSGNPPLWPRLHTGPYGATGKTMDQLWDEFIVDLTARIDAKNAALAATPRQDGAPLVPVQWSIRSLAAAADGAVLAIVHDGITRPKLVRVDAQGRMRTLRHMEHGAHIDVRADGAVLIARPEICANTNLYYDLYEYTEAHGLRRLTKCSRYVRGAWVGDGAAATLAALKNDDGRSSVLQLARDGKLIRTLVEPAPIEFERTEIAVSPDSRRLALIEKHAGRWHIYERDLTAPDATPVLRLTRATPIYALRYARAPQAAGELQFVSAHDGVPNVWRLPADAADITRLTHTMTAVTSHAGVGTDGALVVAVMAPGGNELRRLAQVAALESVPAVVPALAPAAPARLAAQAAQAAPAAQAAQASQAAQAARRASAPSSSAPPLAASESPAQKPDAQRPADAAAQAGQLRDERKYLALRSLYPRSWLPAGFADRGLAAVGATTFGSDALDWHQYAVTGMWEFSQDEPLGTFEYLYLASHYFAVARELRALQWTGPSGEEDIVRYERKTRLQWVSTAPWLRLDRRVRVGIGAALDRTEDVPVAAQTARTQDERIAAAFLDYDTRESNWLSEGVNEGYRFGLLYETYRPFNSGGQNDYNGHIVRGDLQFFFPLGPTALATQYTEVKASGATEPFQLGGAVTTVRLLGPKLNDRDLMLRGYEGTEAFLRGRNARAASIEWRTPIADIDRHAMVPAVGINRVSAAVFFDIGGAWEAGGRPAKYYRGAGVEALAELRFLYGLKLPVRLGVARGLDDPAETRVYFRFGRSF